MPRYVTQGKVTQNYYTPVDYIRGRKMHEGLDLVTPGSYAVIALTKGVVSKVIDKHDESVSTGYGNEIWIEHDNGLTSRSCHMKQGSLVEEGERVDEGEIIGYTGRTGYRVPKTTYHIHYEEYLGESRIDPLTSPNQISREDMEKEIQEYIDKSLKEALDERFKEFEKVLKRSKRNTERSQRSKKLAKRALLKIKNTRRDIKSKKK